MQSETSQKTCQLNFRALYARGTGVAKQNILTMKAHLPLMPHLFVAFLSHFALWKQLMLKKSAPIPFLNRAK